LPPGFFLRVSRALRLLQGKPLVAEKASPWSVPGRALLAFLRGPRNSVTPPMHANSPTHISQSAARGRHSAGKLPLQEGESRRWVCLLPAEPATLLSKRAPSIILRDRGHEPRRKILGHALQGRILLFKEALHIGRNLILVAKQKVIRVK